MASPNDTLADVGDDWDFPSHPHPKSAPRSHGPPASAVLEAPDTDTLQSSGVPAPATPRVVPRSTKASPTAQEYQTWSTIQDASEWAGFKERDMEIFLSLLAKLKWQPDDSLEEFATTDPGDYLSDLQTWSVDDTLASSGEKTKARRLMHAARVAFGLEDSHDVAITKRDNEKRRLDQIAWYAAQPKVTKYVKTDSANAAS